VTRVRQRKPVATFDAQSMHAALTRLTVLRGLVRQPLRLGGAEERAQVVLHRGDPGCLMTSRRCGSRWVDAGVADGSRSIEREHDSGENR
jgi:hypothetical protein